MIKKLREKRGISMVYAIFALMIVSIVSAAIINASLSSLSRRRDEKKARQAYLTVNSSAALVRDFLDGDSISYSVKKTTTTIYKKSGGSWVQQSTSTSRTYSAVIYTEAEGAPENPLAELLTSWIKKSADGSFSAEGTEQETLLFNATAGETALSEVSVCFIMDEELNLRVLFSLSGNPDTNYCMTLLLPCDGALEDSLPSNTVSDTQTDTTRTVVEEQTSVYTIDWDLQDASLIKGLLSE